MSKGHRNQTEKNSQCPRLDDLRHNNNKIAIILNYTQKINCIVLNTENKINTHESILVEGRESYLKEELQLINVEGMREIKNHH